MGRDGTEVFQEVLCKIYVVKMVKNTITYAAETWCLKAKYGGKNKFHRNVLLATLGSNFQEGQN